ncbi:hypothetical protein [Sanguibacter sp. 25GB23B1]|uniref:hypothetical protein n=1 Tax=unclassified Sanguibacter TaxID=2645534 RepID=UPI0032AF5747
MRAVSVRSRRLAVVLAFVLVAGGVVAAVVGVVRWLEPVTSSTGHVAVPMQLRSSDGVGADLVLEVDQKPYPEVSVWGVSTGGLPDRDYRSEPIGVVTVRTYEASLSEQLLSRADALLRGVALLVAALALRPVLVAISQGRPFRPAHHRLINVVAVCVVAGAYVAPILPWWASALVLSRLDDAYGMSTSPPHHFEAFVVAALIVLVGAIVRASAPDPDDEQRELIADHVER